MYSKRCEKCGDPLTDMTILCPHCHDGGPAYAYKSILVSLGRFIALASGAALLFFAARLLYQLIP